jgi:mannose-6-phosphate isomerase class I
MLDFTALPVEEVRRRFQPEPVQLDRNRSLLLGEPVTGAFRIEMVEVTGPMALESESFSINIVLGGQVRLAAGAGKWTFAERDRYFVPAGAGRLQLDSAGCRILRCLPPV